MQRIPGTITPSPNIPPREGMRWRVIVGKERSERKNRQDRDHLATKYNQNQRKNGMTKIECRSTKVFGPHHCYPLPPSSCKQKMKSGSLSRSASQPSQQPKEKTHAASVEKPPVEKTTAALTEKSPTKGGSETSSKRKKHMVQKAEKGMPPPKTRIENPLLRIGASRKERSRARKPLGASVKYPNVTVVEDPFTDRPKDANVEIENSQPFDDNVYPED
ncbi:hypothetical protein BHE74_00041925 [Ensete ventricosum]|nr:hypothetical protein BHE74_00041925 [Ensete ventricosum]